MGEWLDRFMERAQGVVTDNDTVDTWSSPSCVRNAKQLKDDDVSAVSLSVNGSNSVASIGDGANLRVEPPTLTTVLDFETRNTTGCKLKIAGAWRYAADPGTEILTLVYHAGGRPYLWTPAQGLIDPIAGLAADPGVTFVSHSGFEQAIWQRIMVERYGFAPLPVCRWHDTQAAFAYHALPLDLDRALIALGLPVVKDRAGRLLTLSLSRVNKKTGRYPEITPEALQRVAEYNQTDVDGTLALDNALGRLPKRERRIWELDQLINQRGLGIDLDFVRAAKTMADRLMEEAVEEFPSLTGLDPTQVQAVRNWLTQNGTDLADLQAETIEAALEAPLPEKARRVLEIRAMVAATSLKKLNTILACAGEDGRARGLLQYHGANPGRWTGRLLQPQNFPRPLVKVEDPEELIAAVKTGDPEALRRWGTPVDGLVSSLRYAIVAHGDALFGAGDFETVEARIVLALAGQHDKVELLAGGADVYRDVATDIFKIVDKTAFLAIPKSDLTPEQGEQRQIGKNTVLGCGFGLGWKGFRDKYCKDDDTLAKRIVNTYRQTWAPRVPRLWYDLERAAIQAIQIPGRIVTAACGIRYKLETKAGLPFLVCQILNGKKFHYANAQLEMRDSGWGSRPSVTYWAIKDHQWRKIVAWHGRLTENVVQAVARELLVDAMFRFEARGYPVVLTVHDEILVEAPGITRELIGEIMSVRPQWAVDAGIPVAVDAWIGSRYRK
jgi:DNA polymerase bacteriophage-type